MFQQMINEDDKLNSKHHTLYKKEIAEKEVKVTKNTYKKTPKYTAYRMFIAAFHENERGLHDIFNQLWDAGVNDTLELRINSRGGFVNEGSQFYSLIKNKFQSRTTTILDACGYSMGALIFCMGDKRVITPRSDLMFHDYSGAVWGKGGEIESRFKHITEHLREFFFDVIVKPKFLKKKEYKQMLAGTDFWMKPKELCQRGIATHVLLDGKEIKAKKYLKLIS